ELIEKAFTLDDMLAAKEVFITSATTLVWPIVKVNNQVIGKGEPGEIAIRLREIYLQKTQ
ncbi:D-amino acid aminotransferase, partial [Providencia huaxiensis]